jgi:hypothetical protein
LAFPTGPVQYAENHDIVVDVGSNSYNGLNDTPTVRG